MVVFVYCWTFQLHTPTFEYQINSPFRLPYNFHADLISQMNNSQNYTQIVWQSQSLIEVLFFSEGKTWKSIIPFSTFSDPFSFFKYFFPDISRTSNFLDANFCDFLRRLYFAKIAKNPRNKTRAKIDPHKVCFSYTRVVAWKVKLSLKLFFFNY